MRKATPAQLKKIALAALLCAPLLAACTQSPETTFEWGVNDRLPVHHIINVMRATSPEECSKMFELVDYHGFGKARFPEALLTEVLTPHKLTAE